MKMSPVQRLMRLIFLLLSALVLACPGPAALAEDVYTVDASANDRCTMAGSYLRVTCPLEGECRVTVMVRDAWGSVIYQRDHGLCRGSFRSDEIYLPLSGDSAVYTVTVEAGGASRTLRVTRTRPLVTDSGVYAAGLPLSDITGGRSNKQAVILCPEEIAREPLTVPLVSGAYTLGTLTFRMRDGVLTAEPELLVPGSIDKATVYVARDAVTAMTLGSSRFTGEKLRKSLSVDLTGVSCAAVMVQLTVSYDASAAVPCRTDEALLEMQQALWLRMLTTTANEAVG